MAIDDSFNADSERTHLILLARNSVAVKRILTNEVYIGNLVQGKKGTANYKDKKVKLRPENKRIMVENTHEPIVSTDVWKKVQKMFKETQKYYDEYADGIISKKDYLMINSKYDDEAEMLSIQIGATKKQISNRKVMHYTKKQRAITRRIF